MDEVMEQRTILHLQFEIERLERELQHKNEVISQQADRISQLESKYVVRDIPKGSRLLPGDLGTL